MSNPRIMLAAPRSGSGKTMITCALLKALSLRGMAVRSFKCGPDYIDPMFHQRVLGIPSRNLDLFFTGEEETRGLFACDDQVLVSVIEGVMGLYDGLAGTREEASSHHLAKVLGSPIVLVVNARGMGRSVLAEIAGFLFMDKEKLIKGVILNQVTESFFQSIAPLIEKELNVKALGYFPTRKELEFQSRHLGLLLPDEIKALDEKLTGAAMLLEKTVCIDELLKIAAMAGEVKTKESVPWLMEETGKEKDEAKVKIAVARDEAFCFYYEDNLRLLKNAGAELCFFSPIHEEALPSDAKGLLLGGGYPELFAKELSENEKMRKSIQKAVLSGMPSLAECGGFMYLHDEIVTENGSYPMAGVISGRCENAGKLVRFGYVSIELPDAHGSIRGHEFHYFDSTAPGEDCLAVKPVTGKSWRCGYFGEDHFWAFGHLYYPSNPDFARRFVEQCKRRP